MKFRTRKGSLRLATTLGHVTHLTEEWKELPEIFHAEAYANGCISDEMAEVLAKDGSLDESKVDVDQSPEQTRMDSVRAAVKEMNDAREVDGMFTDSGLPNLRRLREIAGFEVTAEERDTAWNEFI